MSNVFSLQESLTPLPSPLTSESLIHFAKESELNQNYELAARYYQEVDCHKISKLKIEMMNLNIKIKTC